MSEIAPGSVENGAIKALGKRKRGDGEISGSHGSTVFVSNLPYTATSVDLQTLFSDIAPVRSAFVVLEGGVSKGVGYVSFAVKEDAEKAMETLEADGLTLNGRKLRVQWPENKPKDKNERTKTEKPSRPTPRAPTSKLHKDPDAIRTIIISGLPPSIDQKAVWKKVKKYDGAEKVELHEGVAHALFKTPAAASRAVEKLHAHVFKGSLLSVTLKKRVETLVKPAREAKSVSAAAPSRSSRLIIRNLPWNITERDLRALFLPYGPIHSIHIPSATTTEENKKPKARGFAFVWFLSRKDAEHAIEGVNGRTVSAGGVVAPTMNKKERARMRRRLRESGVKAGEGEGGSEDEGDEDTQDEGDADGDADEKKAKESTERVVAVDWALSKERWEEAKETAAGDKSSAETGEGGEEEDGPGSSSGSSSESGDSSGDDSDPSVSDEEDDNNSEDGMDIDDLDEEEKPVKPSLPPPDAGTTLFVRNVPFEATEDELRTLFRTFGPLRYARITMDASTGRSRGTGFVCFWNSEDADKAVHQSELLSRETGLGAPKKNPFTLPSILTPDPSSSLAQSLVLHGRTLDVTRAVTRDQAAHLKEEGERKREKADKRNLYLLREGVIFPNTPAAATLNEAEVEKRTTSFTTRRQLLKSNPSLYVSKTRLSVRQLPLFTTERSLKRLAVHAVRAFEKEVKSKTREPLSADDLRADDVDENVDVPVDVEEGKGKAQAKTTKGKKGERKTGVKQAKIVRQADRVDSITGKGRSRGYGFLEMEKHCDSLRVLRWANNNPDVGPLLEEWWKAEVEEFIKQPNVAEKGKDNSAENAGGENHEARMKRMKDELTKIESGSGKKNKGTLVIEFSIENVQVVARRKTVQKERAEAVHTQGNSSTKLLDDRGPKRRKLSSEPAANEPPPNSPKRRNEAESAETPKTGQKIGSLIGRKRKQRKGARG
ncbi:RNA-binding domain-containing protein [Rickenella mellea]|uniref:RNA-binding domain-containing protein n=1 Tax=Rickenella mellea TaxID=50990 RepID=A0A4Y7PXZ8_9AGAM|nr:RNA-binding domain-containing protein [Rickenella mellea]